MRNLLFCQDCYGKWHFVENWKTGDATRSCLLKYRHLFYRTFQPLLPPFNTCTVVETKVIFKIVIITITTTYLKTIDIRAISEKRNRLRLAWFDMIIIEQCYLFRRGFTKEIAKIKSDTTRSEASWRHFLSHGRPYSKTRITVSFFLDYLKSPFSHKVITL